MWPFNNKQTAVDELIETIKVWTEESPNEWTMHWHSTGKAGFVFKTSGPIITQSEIYIGVMGGDAANYGTTLALSAEQKEKVHSIFNELNATKGIRKLHSG